MQVFRTNVRGLFSQRRFALSRNDFTEIPKRLVGYILLIPQVDEYESKNPLLKDDKMPDFSDITTEKCRSIIVKQCIQLESEIDSITESLKDNENPDIFNDVLSRIEEATVPLDISWGIVNMLHHCKRSIIPEKIHVYSSKRVQSARHVKFSCKAVFKACEDAKEKNLNLTDQQRAVLSMFLLEGRLNGLNLVDKNSQRFKYDNQMINGKRWEYTGRYMSSIKAFTQEIKNPLVVQNFPERFLKAIAVDPSKPHVGPWRVTLNEYVYKNFMECCPDRELRQFVWEFDATKVSLYQGRFLQTSTALEEIRFRLNDKAQVLGYQHYAEMSMETKMAGTLENLYKTLDTLLNAARPAQEREFEELRKFARDKHHINTVKIWDIPFLIREHWRAQNSKYWEYEIQEYFPFPKVLSGLFDLIKTLFNVEIIETKKVNSWHEDVRFFDVFDLTTSSTKPIAHFYLDAYAREGDKSFLRYDSGNVIPIIKRSQLHDTPLIAIIFNFEPPKHGKPALLRFLDVEILFKMFGQALQYLLTKCEYSDISGVSNVEWDAVEISTHFMNNWLYEPSILLRLSKHYDNGMPLPEKMIQSIKKKRLHFAGYSMCKELYLSRLDLELYSSSKFWVPIMEEMWKRHFVFPLEKKDSHVCSFNVIFTTALAAGYYSNIWSQMIAADIFTAFQEIPLDSEDQQKELGLRYRDMFLATGGTYSARELFRRFRGRDPSPDAFLKSLDLKAATLSSGENDLIK